MANLLELRFTSLLNQFVQFSSDRVHKSLNLSSLLYSITMLRDNYLLEHIDGSLKPMRDLYKGYEHLKKYISVKETQRKAKYMDEKNSSKREYTYLGSLGPVLQYTKVSPYGLNKYQNTSMESYCFWAVLSYVFGIGDRHLSNILFNKTDGSINFVDFELVMKLGLR